MKAKSFLTLSLACAGLFTGMTPAYGQFGRLTGGRRAAPSTATVPTAMPTAPSLAAGPEPTGPKKDGVIRIGVVAPQSNMGPASGQADIAEGLRAEWTKLLIGPTLEAVRLTASLPGQAEAEAKVKQCDYVLYSSVAQKLPEQNGSRKGILRGASTLANSLPMLGMARGLGGAVATTVASSAISGAVDVASTVKAKASVTLEYSVMKIEGGDPVARQTASATATQDGEDVITPLVRQAAGEISQKTAAK